MSSRISSACQSYFKISPLTPHPLPAQASFLFSALCLRLSWTDPMDPHLGSACSQNILPAFFLKALESLSLWPASSSHRHFQSWFNLSSILAPSQTRFPTPCHRPRPKRGSPAFDPLLEKATWSHALSPRGAGPGRNGHLAVHALALGTPGAATSGSVLGASPRRSVRWRREDMTLVPPAGQGHSINGGTNSYYY